MIITCHEKIPKEFRNGAANIAKRFGNFSMDNNPLDRILQLIDQRSTCQNPICFLARRQTKIYYDATSKCF